MFFDELSFPPRNYTWASNACAWNWVLPAANYVFPRSAVLPPERFLNRRMSLNLSQFPQLQNCGPRIHARAMRDFCLQHS